MTDSALSRTDDPGSHGVSTQADVLAIEGARSDPIGDVRSTYDLLRRTAARQPHAPALSFFLRTEDHVRPVTWSHRAWFEQITRAANMFRRLGVRRGDPVAFILPNLPETHWTIWGAEAAGIAFAINPLLEPSLMAELMNAARPRVLVTVGEAPGTDLWAKVRQAVAGVPSLETIVTVDPLRHLRSPLAPVLRLALGLKTGRRAGRARVRPWQACMRGVPGDRLEFEPPELLDVASYFCTGGTTGLPKIAVRTHRTEVANALELAATFGGELQGEGKSVFCGLPLFHVNAQLGTGLAPWSTGAHVLLGTPQGYRSPGLLARFWDIAERHRFVFFSGVPTVYSALLQHPPRPGQDLSALKYGICGAAPMPVELFNRFEQATGIKILEGYGLTEGGCVSSINPPKGRTRLGSIGLRLPWQDMRAVLLDADGRFARDAEVDEPGVLVVRGPNLFKGYLDPVHEQGLWIERPDADGCPQRWLNTGDLGRQDAEGYFWLTGRKKELIIRGGHNIDPRLIEDALHAHPGVALAAAVGRPDRHAGEVPVLYIQPRPGVELSVQDLQAYAQAHIAERAAWPKQVIVVPALPTTAIGKIHKPTLTLQQLEAVVRAEARECGTVLRQCEAALDPGVGPLVQWAADGDAAPLRERLAGYTFRSRELA